MVWVVEIRWKSWFGDPLRQNGALLCLQTPPSGSFSNNHPHIVTAKVARIGAHRFVSTILCAFLCKYLPCNEWVTWYLKCAIWLHLTPHFSVTTPRYASKIFYQTTPSMIKLSTVGRSCHHSIHLSYVTIQQFASICPRNQLAVQTLTITKNT